MAPVLPPLQKYFQNNIIIYIAFCLLFMPKIALADRANNNYEDPPPQTGGTSGGSRLKGSIPIWQQNGSDINPSCGLSNTNILFQAIADSKVVIAVNAITALTKSESPVFEKIKY